MKIQCDVCGVEQASILCCADEAALCSGCDGRIHSANKLAGKHRRFSLFLPPSRPLPLCDICKKKNGFVFCQEDRAILCRDCDVPIHKANVHAGRHSRFLLTGIRLSSSPIPSSEDKDDLNTKITVAEEKPVCRTAATKVKDEGGGGPCSGGGGSSITDYLMKMLPGWRVDDFLFDDPAAGEKEAVAGLWKVHGAQPPVNVSLFTSASLNATTEVAGSPEMQWRPLMSSEEVSRASWSEEEASMVPELTPFHCNYKNNKRPRTSLWF
ncbi:B-box zinc finger protein 20-like [Phalaenopsis equestris]|uniref:B-box zinc finger protein 20-like n=1 Tax=Phalaenopsis equestris TaxID=78828 RepID=UPI0009E518CC|nr:B-box zinc finger protein 20-like [Phalaenopsis equestris]